MKSKLLIFTIVLTIALSSCSTLKFFNDTHPVKISLLAGINKGGITENTDMSVIPGVATPAEAIVDAFSGSTQTGFHGGIHFSQAAGIGEVETGVDLMHNKQLFNYIDAGNFYIGVRRLGVTQLMIPITFNFPILKKKLPSLDLGLKAGLIGQTNFITSHDSGIRLPEYTYNNSSIGVTAGLKIYPLHFENGSKLGLYLDIYRGSIIYEDFYNKSSFEMPGSSFVRLGLQYQFK